MEPEKSKLAKDKKIKTAKKNKILTESNLDGIRKIINKKIKKNSKKKREHNGWGWKGMM